MSTWQRLSAANGKPVHDISQALRQAGPLPAKAGVKKIQFTRPYEDETEETNPYVYLEEPGKLDDLPNPNEIVAPNKIVIEYSYPLDKPVYFLHQSTDPAGFTRRTLALSISGAYKQIYDEEDSAVGDPGHIPGMMNRASSAGPYGIWGHDLGDLLLHTVERVDRGGQYHYQTVSDS